MAYNNLTQLINAFVNANGVQAITGQILNGVLNQMVSQLGYGSQFMGIAVPQTYPSQQDIPMWYIASTPGRYDNFGGLNVTTGEVCILKTHGNGTWTKSRITIVPDKTSQLTNDSGFVTNSVNDLLNYYLKSETYTMDQVNDLLAAVHQFQFELADALPTASADTMYKIYLVPSALPDPGDAKDEYLTIRTGTEGSYVYTWEQIGRVRVDLSAYSTTVQMNAAIDAALSSYISSIEATVDNSTGVPYAEVGYSDGVLVIDFHNIKGDPGVQGPAGPVAVTSAQVTVDGSTGTPTATVSLENGVLKIAFTGLKGEQGNTGVSADYPITIVNNLTQGGASDALSAEMGKNLNNRLTVMEGMVGDGTQSIDTMTATWVQGSIFWDDGTNITSTTSIRSGFLTTGNGHVLKAVCATGYFIKGVFAYNSASLSDFYGVFYRGNASGTMDTSKTSIEVASFGKVLRLVVGKVDGTTIVAGDGANVTVTDIYEGLGGSTVVDHILDLENEVASINSIPVLSQTINATVADTYIAADGSLVDQTSTYRTTPAIDVEQGDVFTYIGFVGYLALGCASYDSDGVFVSSLLGPGDYDNNIQTITIPSGIAKVRFCGRIDTHPLEIKKTGGATETSREAVTALKEYVYYLSGKTLYVIGDSIAYGSVANGTPPSKPFPVLVAEQLGMNLVNYGIGGSTITPDVTDGGMYASLADLEAATKETGKYYTVLTGNQSYQVYYWDGATLSTSTHKLRTPIALRYAFMGNDADVVIVEAGTNDFQYNWMPIGTMADRTDDTFYGALHVLCLGLLDKFKGKSLVFMTPIKRAQTVQDTSADTEAHKGGSYGSVESTNLFGLTLGDYADIIKEVCRYYSIPVIDMYANSLLNPSVTSQVSLFDSWKTHPFQEGHNMMARYIVGQLRAIVGMSI